MNVFDAEKKVLDAEIFPLHTITDSNSGITLIETHTHTHTHTHTQTHTHTHVPNPIRFKLTDFNIVFF